MPADRSASWPGAGTYEWPASPNYIPLGSYTDVQSPWGLWDASGAAQEWTEEIVDWGTGPLYRHLDGTYAASPYDEAYVDLAYGTYFDHPAVSGHYGLRVASAVPGKKGPNMKSIQRAIGLTLGLSIHGGARADCGNCTNCVIVTRYSQTGIPESCPAEWPTGLGQVIPVELNNNHSKVVIRCNPTSADMGKIIVTGSSENVVWVLVTTDTNEGNTTPPPSAAANWAGLEDNRGDLRLRAEIDADLTDPPRAHIRVAKMTSIHLHHA